MDKVYKLSALIVARNEEAQLQDCLQRLGFADEVVVLLDRTTDGSKAIAQGFGAKVVEGSWPVEGARRHAGVDACSGEWILEVDADERVTPELAAEVHRVLSARVAVAEGPVWWRVPFDNYIGHRLVKHGWGAQFGVGARAALFRKGVKSWGMQRVHPKVVIQGLCGGALQSSMTHYLDRDISDMLNRLDRYTTARAQDLIEEGDIGTLRKNVLRIFGRFWKCFVLRKGYREGGLGLVIAIFAALYPILSYMKAVEMQSEKALR